jgi:hypothetical protein
MKHKLVGISNGVLDEVWLDGKYIDPAPSQKVYNHSPDGFNHGYCGSGPAQLALAIVLKLTGISDGYKDFKNDVIVKIPNGDFSIEFEYNNGTGMII